VEGNGHLVHAGYLDLAFTGSRAEFRCGLRDFRYSNQQLILDRARRPWRTQRVNSSGDSWPRDMRYGNGAMMVSECIIKMR
jgi:hypothetical protein